jgi:chromate reductase, NAD(P)H dehydrogenase (quinone)
MTLHVLGIAGSLRAGSYNRALLRAAATLLPEGMMLETAEIGDIPLYDADLEAKGIPEVVKQLKMKMAAADAVLIATPEYNYSIPGVLKNAIDWVSRAPDPPLTGKPAAIMGASMGMMGTVRSQLHLRQVCVFLNVLLMNKPEVLVARAQEKFGADGTLTDEPTREAVRKLLVALRDWTLFVQRGRERG